MSDRPLRLRLHIQRNGLPDTRIVFLLPTTDDTTVTKLLEQVNETVPLESTDWGLDDYVVELASSSNPASRTSGAFFECLHYQLVSKLFDRDDEVFIRPLSSEDLKKRRISGRHQISADGKRLVDGVPFGRPLLKRHRRPPVAIAPRKRRRPLGSAIPDDEEEDEDDIYGFDEQEDGNGTQLIRYLPDEDDSNSSSSDYEDEDEEDLDASLDADELQDLREDAKIVPRRVHFTAAGTTSGVDDESSSEDEDFGDSDSDSDSGDDSDSSSDSDADESSNDSEDDKPQEISSKRNAANGVAPNQGKARTKKRNARRRAKRAMSKTRPQEASANKSLASAGPAAELATEPTASTESPTSLGRRLRLDMSAGRRLIASALGLRAAKATPQPTQQSPLHAETNSTSTSTTHEMLTSTTPLQAIHSTENNTIVTPAPPEGHPDHWASRINYTAVECSDENFALDAPTFPFVQQWHANKNNKGKNGQPQNNTQHRAAPVKAGAKRKQGGLAAVSDEPRPNKRAAPAPETDSSSESESDSDSDSGDGDFKISLDADWGGSSDSGSECSSDSSNSGSDSENDKRDETKTPGEAEESEETEETGDAGDKELPPLPADIASLPALQPGDAVEGMVVTWKNWVLSEKTNWQPQVTDVTAKVVGIGDDGATLRVVLAHRDRDLDRKPEKKYDEETGERVYGRFDGPDMEDDDEDGQYDEGGGGGADGVEAEAEDTGHRSLALADMLEPRILQAAATWITTTRRT